MSVAKTLVNKVRLNP